MYPNVFNFCISDFVSSAPIDWRNWIISVLILIELLIKILIDNYIYIHINTEIIQFLHSIGAEFTKSDIEKLKTSGYIELYDLLAQNL